MSGAMTMLDQIWHMLSPQKELDKRRSTSSAEHKFGGRLRKKSKKADKKPLVEEKKLYLDTEFCKHKTSLLDLAKVTKKPALIEDKEWVATHTISLFHNVNLLYGAVSEFCTADSCPIMLGPCQTQYSWIDERGKKIKCTAPQYADYVMTFCQKCVSNSDLFPTKYAQDFSENFTNDIKKMLRFLYHVISHMYYAHFVRLRQLELHFYLNVVFKHFTYLVREFSLLERRETASLDDLVQSMGLYPSTSQSTTSLLNTSSPQKPLLNVDSRSVLPSSTHTNGTFQECQN